MYERNYYFDEKDFKLINEDVFEATKHMQEKTFDMIFADPPYFLSNNGITCSGGKMVSVNKGEWDKELSVQEKHEFNRKWIKECYRLLKDEGTIWISGTLHNITWCTHTSLMVKQSCDINSSINLSEHLNLIQSQTKEICPVHLTFCPLLNFGCFFIHNSPFLCYNVQKTNGGHYNERF